MALVVKKGGGDRCWQCLVVGENSQPFNDPLRRSKIKHRSLNNWGKICEGHVHKEFLTIIVLIDICTCTLKKATKIKTKALLETLDSFFNIKFRALYKHSFYVVPESTCYHWNMFIFLLTLISIFSITVKMFYFFIFAVWDERFLVGGGLHWAYRQELGQTAQATQNLRGRVNLLLYTMTHVYSYPPISGSTQCQVSVLRLNAVCAIILDFFPRLSQTKNPCTIWIWKIKTKHKNCTIWKNILNSNLNLRNL